ncbi:MAG: flavodoxin family protein [Clostridiaceae bacterium]
MENLYIIQPEESISEELQNMISSFVTHYSSFSFVKDAKTGFDLKGKKLLFAVEIDETGYDIKMLQFVFEIRNKDPRAFENSVGAVLIHSSTALGTKRFTQDIIFLANGMGCTFIGQPMVEATKDMQNFLTWQKTIKLPLDKICYELSGRLGERFMKYEHKKIANPKITVLYSSPHKYSNTMLLWKLIKEELQDFTFREILIENGMIADCKGCSYTMCRHHSDRNTCFYGGFMVENVLPAIEEADCVIWLCPNYNDSYSANLSATINRLTVLCHKQNFRNKLMYGVVVSGNSGSDSVGKQLIGSLNLNKGFKLPPYAIFSETANDPGAILKVKDIDRKAKLFAANFYKEFESGDGTNVQER